ncbi:MAG: hypothetical protein BA864_05210 [Desulfuromonadales bacterium C00003093]|jgi:hypothetical protein|nr:MAG: hypothetical protein BA864_05210 [Desulfuromonadales bacterium C00003093]
MIIKLCYKEYEARLTLDAMKSFKSATGKDLWCSLLQFTECWRTSDGDGALTRVRKLYEVMDFETASQLFYAMIKPLNKSIPLAEIEDAMFRVGWLPSDREDDMSEPWPLVMVKLSYDVDAYFNEGVKEKK